MYRTVTAALMAVAFAFALPLPAAKAEDVISKIQKSGVLRVGMAPSPPDQSPNPDQGCSVLNERRGF